MLKLKGKQFGINVTHAKNLKSEEKYCDEQNNCLFNGHHIFCLITDFKRMKWRNKILLTVHSIRFLRFILSSFYLFQSETHLPSMEIFL